MSVSIKKIKELKAKIAELQKELKPEEAALKKALEARVTPIKQGHLVAMLKVSTVNRFDTTTFKAERSDLYDAYVVEGERKQLVIS